MPLIAPDELEDALAGLEQLDLPRPSLTTKAKASIRRGRPPVAPRTTMVRFIVDVEALAEFDAKVKSLGISRAEGLRRLIDATLD